MPTVIDTSTAFERCLILRCLSPKQSLTVYVFSVGVFLDSEGEGDCSCITSGHRKKLILFYRKFGSR